MTIDPKAEYLAYLKTLPRYGAPGKQNRRGTPIESGRPQPHSRFYVKGPNGALRDLTSEPLPGKPPTRDRIRRRKIAADLRDFWRSVSEDVRQMKLTARLKRRAAAKGLVTA